ncbi:MAG: D-aminoacyl-tRNA deacylase [Chloroflexota bacterium]|nr:D-aminoacyl-tRNA deacylase [Chloroflexota bacterium]
MTANDVRLVIQRVTRATVRSGGDVLGAIGPGAVVLAGAAAGDTPEIVDRIAAKLVGLRYFRDADGRTNIDIAEAGGSFLVVSQFTLLADLRRGRRPGFTTAALPEIAEPLVARLIERLGSTGAPVASGRFGADMEVEIVNDGPFTLVLDSDRDLAAVAEA